MQWGTIECLKFDLQISYYKILSMISDFKKFMFSFEHVFKLPLNDGYTLMFGTFEQLGQ